MYVCDMTHVCVWHDSFMCVKWLIYLCDYTAPRVCACVCACVCVTDTAQRHKHQKKIDFYVNDESLMYICKKTQIYVCKNTEILIYM